jgi:DHA1 family bicyclomycin/chloramphenicol resistance-like MFS transporter
LIAMGLIGASQLNTVLLKNYTSEEIIRVALRFQSIIGVVMVIITVFGSIDLFIIIFMIFIFLCCQGFIFPNASALSLASFGHNAGSASALLGGIQMGIGAGTSALVSLLQNHTALPMTGVMACCAIGAFGVLALGRKVITEQASIESLAEEDVGMMSKL